MKLSTVILIPLFVVGCGGSATPPASEPAAPSVSPAPVASAEPAPAAKTETSAAPEAKTESPPAPARPKASKFTIDGTSVSDVTQEQLAAALKKRGFEVQATPETKVGKYEQLGGAAKKGKSAVMVSISRWAAVAKPITDGTTESDFAPASLEKNYAKNGATAQAYDADGDVLVSIMGSAKDQKPQQDLLKDLVARPK